MYNNNQWSCEECVTFWWFGWMTSSRITCSWHLQPRGIVKYDYICLYILYIKRQEAEDRVVWYPASHESEGVLDPFLMYWSINSEPNYNPHTQPTTKSTDVVCRDVGRSLRKIKILEMPLQKWFSKGWISPCAPPSLPFPRPPTSRKNCKRDLVQWNLCEDSF